MSEGSGWAGGWTPDPVYAQPTYADPNGLGGGWLTQNPGVNKLVNASLGFATGLHKPAIGTTSPAAAPPQWSAASYAPSQFANRPQAAPQQGWTQRPMPQQPGNAVGRMPQQASPMVRALRGQ